MTNEEKYQILLAKLKERAKLELTDKELGNFHLWQWHIERIRDARELLKLIGEFKEVERFEVRDRKNNK